MSRSANSHLGANYQNGGLGGRGGSTGRWRSQPLKVSKDEDEAGADCALLLMPLPPSLLTFPLLSPASATPYRLNAPLLERGVLTSAYRAPSAASAAGVARTRQKRAKFCRSPAHAISPPFLPFSKSPHSREEVKLFPPWQSLPQLPPGSKTAGGRHAGADDSVHSSARGRHLVIGGG